MSVLQSILTKLSEKAHAALASAQDKQPSALKTHGSRWNLKQEDSEDELAIFSGRTRFVSSKRGSLSPASFSPQPMEINTSSYPLSQREAQPLSAAPSYYSDASMSSSPSIDHWASEPRRDEYVEPRREQYIPMSDRHMSQQYQPLSHYRTQEHTPVPSPVSYQWQQDHNVPSQYYGGQIEQPYAPAAHHDNYGQQQPQIFPASFQGGRQPLPPLSELADLGLAARDSRLDERWSSFMQDSGLLDEVHNQNRSR